ncbi:mucin-2 [Phlebotomus argentipes]|uniref:mucin-2 n=1 Tax=Phlebotomus argentipes TaxID=94469 RepID=UPI002892E7C2|nr:mucin-2 [Phlebotomus argentipes]
MGISTTTSDFNQWLHAMKMVARLPGGIPPEFRKKLWISLSDQYLHTKNVDWEKEQEKCFCDQSGVDDEELGIQIVKDLHRTGSSLCSGPAGSLNQAKLKKVLLGYARWNPSVGYCQGFNMLGALILQVLDKNEGDTIKVMIYLIEGVLPPKYFCDSLNGLQTDMAVFRDLLSTKVPRLSKHLYKLQGSVGEESFEPPLTNVFTMQWFLTIFCTCLPINSVLRIWDLILIEGSDILLRTALAIWTFLEERIIGAKTADDFYCKMGTLSAELLNGNLIDSNGLVQRVVDLGPITDLQQLRDKHVYNVANFKDKKGYRLFYSDDEGDSDDDSRMAVATAWGIRMGRRESVPVSSNQRPSPDSRDKVVLDINLLKHQYERLRERQRQAQIILTAACARQPANTSSAPTFQVNQLLFGRNAILSNKGRRIGPPQGAIPPPRRASASAKARSSPKATKREETLHWNDTDVVKMRKNNLKWKDAIHVDETPEKTDEQHSTEDESSSAQVVTRLRKRSESSSYSEDSSTSTSLCDDDDDNTSSFDASPFKKKQSPDIQVPTENKAEDIQKYIRGLEEDTEITASGLFLEHPIDQEEREKTPPKIFYDDNTISIAVEEECTTAAENSNTLRPIEVSISSITSTSQLSPIGDFSGYLSTSCISPLRTPSCTLEFSDFLTNISGEVSPEHPTEASNIDIDDEILNFDEAGITNKLFERIISIDRPKKLDLSDYAITTVTNSTENVMSEKEAPRSISLDPSDLCRQSSPLYSSQIQKLSRTTMNLTTIPSSSDVTDFATPQNQSTQPKTPDVLEITDADNLTLSSSTEKISEYSSNRRNSDKALKIIQENSLILHRLLKKNVSDPDQSTSKAESSDTEVGDLSSVRLYPPEDKSEDPPIGTLEDTDSKDTEQIVEPESIPTSPVYSKARTSLLDSPTISYKRISTVDEPSISNISETLTSIENTIKSINSLCQDRESSIQINRRSRLMEEIEEIIRTPSSKDIEDSKRRSKAINLSPPYDSKDVNSLIAADNTSTPFRGSRDLSRAVSPRRRRDEEREEYESRATRTLSTAPTITKTPADSDSSSSYSSYRKYPDKLEIRHTTVTATLYDRYLSQRNEKSTRLDKSPSSPVITKNYSDYLTAVTTDRVTKSAENSPSRFKTSTSDHSSSISPSSLSKTSPTRETHSILPVDTTRSYNDISHR